MLIFRCFQHLVNLLNDFINFIFLIPNDSSRSAAWKKSEDVYILEAGLYGPQMPLPRPKGLHPSIARLRNQPDKHVGEPTLYGAAHQNDMASPPPKAPHGPHGPHGAQGPQGQGTHSPEFRIRKVVKEPEKPENQPVVGLKGSQPLISLTESDLSSADTMPTFVKKRPSVAGAGAVAVPISSAKTENASFSYESSSSKLPTIAYADLLFLKQIGGGGFGAVWQGVWRGTPVAIKVLTTTSTQSPMEAAFGEEVAVLERMRHPNICLLLGVCWEDGRRAIVTELVSRGSLWDALRTPFGVKVSSLRLIALVLIVRAV